MGHTLRLFDLESFLVQLVVFLEVLGLDLVFYQLESLCLAIPFLGLTFCFVVFSLLLTFFSFARVQLWMRSQRD